jgi:hypothetical protein
MPAIWWDKMAADVAVSLFLALDYYYVNMICKKWNKPLQPFVKLVVKVKKTDFILAIHKNYSGFNLQLLG